MINIDKIDWEIINALCDDWESLEQIYPLQEFPRLPINEVVEKISKFLKNGLIKIKFEIEFDENKIISDYNNKSGTKYWFGLTELGANEWEKYSELFFGEKVDWNNLFNLSYGKGIGYIEASSKEICEKILENEIIKKGIIIIKDSIIHSRVAQIKIRYYKNLSNGFRLDFKYLQT